jgi:hypothetical protein
MDIKRRDFIWQSALIAAGYMLAGRKSSAAGDDAPPSRFAWHQLRANEVRPEGWLLVQAQEDLREGLPGRLDEINDDVTHQRFATQELVVQPGAPAWWTGEQEGYWHEALVHLAFLTGDQDAIGRATDWADAILKKQGPDGYIGIYAPAFRLMPVDDPRYGNNGGELHSQANGFLALLAFYEHTGRAEVLAAVERAARLTMQTYARGVFGTAGDHAAKAGGNSHVINFADPLIQLYRLTGDEAYLKFVALMYEDYNQHPPRDHDLTRASLHDSSAVFVGHGAHTAESFHIVQAAALLGDGETKTLPAIATTKLSRHLTPSGAIVSGEMIDGHLGNGSYLYEHCTQNELVKSFLFVTQYTGDPAMAQRAARTFFNAIQGARLHPLKALEYLSRDDRMDIPTNATKVASNIRNEGSHFQMSSIIRPTCCSGSAGRGLPYYLASTWMKSPDGKKLAAMNFAPCSISTEIAGVPVRVKEETNYPFEDRVVLTIHPDEPVTFELHLRQPPEGKLKMVVPSGVVDSNQDGFFILTKKWQAGDRVELTLDLPVVREATQEGKAQYYRRGALVFGLPFQSDVKEVAENPRWKDQKPSGLFEYDIHVADKSQWGYRIDPNAQFKPVPLPGDPLHPWEKPTLGLKGTMLDAEGKSVPVTLLAEGASLSRRVTFLDSSSSAQEAAQLPSEAKIGIGF